MIRDTSKRVLITLPRDHYERLQKNARLAGFNRNWFSHEITKLVLALDQMVLEILEAQRKGEMMNEEQVLQNILNHAGKVPGLKIELEKPEKE